MHSVFPFSPLAAQNRPSTQAQENSKTELSAEGGDGIFLAFLAQWTQALSETQKTGTASGSLLDLTLSTQQGDQREEETLSLPQTTDLVAFSSSVRELLASVAEGLEEKGIDTAVFSGKAREVLDEVADGGAAINLERLKAALSELKSRYPVSIESRGARHIDIEVQLPESLKIGLEASLKNPPLPVLQEGDPEDDLAGVDRDQKTETGAETSVPDALSISRFYAYLKPEATSPLATERPEPHAGGGSREKREKNVSAPEGSKAASNSPKRETMLPLPDGLIPLPPEGTGSSDNPVDPEGGGAPQEKGSLVSTHEKTQNTAGAEKTVPEEALDTASAKPVEHKQDFGGFFDGVMARRAQADARSAPLELAKDVPLSRDATLREGLDNVVRFIRSSGEHKASLIVDPPALGRISVELTQSASGLEASIKVSSEQIRHMVQDQVVQLRMSLAQQGVQLAHFSVDVHQDNSGQHQPRQHRGGRRGLPGVGRLEEAEDELVDFRVDLNQGLLYWVA